MFNALTKLLGIWTTNHPTGANLFSGSACFSNRVPRATTETWEVHGGQISSGTTSDTRALYFFATDPSEPWVMKLSAKSVMVIHAGWIVHCVDEAFRVPIADYILDDKFVPGPPYKLMNDTPPIYVPLSEPCESSDTESGEFGPVSNQTIDTPSTPRSMPRKRKREQAFFDSPSGSLVFSGFDKNGMPRRPKKQRKLRFDPSFSPKGGRSGKATMGETAPDWFRDLDKCSMQQDVGASALCGPNRSTTVRAPDTPDQPLADKGSATGHHNHRDACLAKPLVSSPPTAAVMQKKMAPVRTIDFTNPPQPIRRSRFSKANDSKSRSTTRILSAVEASSQQVKTPKKISFADYARVRVYSVSPRQPDAKSLILARDDQLEDSDDSTAQTSKDLAPRTSFLTSDDDSARHLGGNQLENDTLTLTMEEVRAMRRHLLESVAKNGDDDDDGQLSTLFELGKTLRGAVFRHVW